MLSRCQSAQALCFVWALGCGAPDSADPVCDSAPTLTWESWGEEFFTSYCQPCHSATAPQRYDAPVGIDFDTEAEVRAMADSIRRAVIEDQTMPVGSGVVEEDLELLDLYLSCSVAP